MKKPQLTLCDRGASAVEYSILIGGIAAVIIVTVFALGLITQSQYTGFSDCVAASLLGATWSTVKH